MDKHRYGPLFLYHIFFLLSCTRDWFLLSTHLQYKAVTWLELYIYLLHFSGFIDRIGEEHMAHGTRATNLAKRHPHMA